MATFHKVDVYRNCHVYTTHGDGVEVEGRPMVLLSHGTIVRAEGYRPSLANAKRDAADQIDEFRVELAGMAAKLRAEADALDAKDAMA